MITLTPYEKMVFIQWVIENVSAYIVPLDESSDEKLIYNLIHLIKGDNKHYQQLPEQDEEIKGYKK